MSMTALLWDMRETGLIPETENLMKKTDRNPRRRRSERTDPHRPSAIVMTDYEVVAYGMIDFEENPETGIMMRYLVLEEAEGWEYGDWDRFPFWSGDREENCGHCGSHLRYYSLVLHKPTQELIRVGLTCTHRFGIADWSYRTEAMKTRAKHDRNERAWIEANPEAALSYQYCRYSDKVYGAAKDIAEKVRLWGKISEKQIDALRRAYADYLARLNVVAVECLEGKVDIVGKILSVKWEENEFAGYGQSAGTLKMTVLDDRGFRVYGTAPESIQGLIPLKGSRVQLTASVERSQKDSSFGFFKRPRKAILLSIPKLWGEEGFVGPPELRDILHTVKEAPRF